MGQKKTKLMLYSTLVEIEVEVGVELGNRYIQVCLPIDSTPCWYAIFLLADLVWFALDNECHKDLKPYDSGQSG